MHFLVNSVFYEPFLRYWALRPLEGLDAEGKPLTASLDLNRMSILCLVAFVITAAMGAGAVLAVYLSARLLWKDDLSAFLAAAALACTHEFVFYAHTGNTDVPATFWFAWAVYFAIRIVRFGQTRDYALTSLCAVLAVGTKDPTIGYVVGLALSVGFWQIHRARTAGNSPLRSLRAAASRQSLLGVGIFILGFCVVNNIVTDLPGYVRRMNTWRGPESSSYFLPPGLATQLRLVVETVKDLHFALGWPLLGLALASLGYACGTCPGKPRSALLPSSPST